MNNNEKLNKQMNPGAVWALAVGSIIGWGCFIQGAEWTRQAGGPIALIIGFLLGSVLMIVIGLCYAYLISKIKVAGGEFAYTYYSFGRMPAFACGWMMLLGYMTLAAMNATAIPVLASYVLPGIFKVGYMYTIAGYEVYFGEVLLSLFFLTLFAILNYLGVQKTGKVQLAMAILLCIIVAIALIGTFITGGNSVENLKPFYGAKKSLFSGILSILVITPYCFVGFDTIPQAAEEYNFSHTKTKKLIVSALIIGAVIYIVMAILTDIVIPWEQLFDLKDDDGDAIKWLTGAMLEKSMGKIGTSFVSIAVLMAIFTGINGFYLAASRLLFSMGRAKMLPTVFGRLNSQHHTPKTAIIFIMMICFVCPFFGRNVLGWVIDMCSVGTAVGYFFTCLSAYKMSKRDKNKGIHPITAFIGAVISLVIFLLLVLPISPAQMSMQSFIALGIWGAVGVVFYAVKYHDIKRISDEELDHLILNCSKKDILRF